MQRRVLVSDDEALASNEHRVELTPFFWQGLAGGFAALVLTGLVFVILTFSQVTQTLTAVKDVAFLANELKIINECNPSANPEWSFMQNTGVPVAYLHQSFPYINMEPMIDIMMNGNSISLMDPLSCNSRKQDTCLTLSPADVWVFLNTLTSNFRSSSVNWHTVCSTGADGVPSDYGLVMSALCEAAATYPHTRHADNSNSKHWPCFALLSGQNEQDEDENYESCYTPEGMATQLEIEKNVVMSLVSKLPPPCKVHQSSLPQAFNN
jgi:hypothetical protein